jgi:hypothetical protein
MMASSHSTLRKVWLNSASNSVSPTSDDVGACDYGARSLFGEERAATQSPMATRRVGEMKSCATLHLSEHAADLGVLAIAFASWASEPASGGT